MQEGAIPQGANVIVVDDLIATGEQTSISSRKIQGMLMPHL
jgi:adenine/guanine phosphoribosyltransferase-like PRPP-binding protein